MDFHVCQVVENYRHARRNLISAFMLLKGADPLRDGVVSEWNLAYETFSELDHVLRSQLDSIEADAGDCWTVWEG